MQPLLLWMFHVALKLYFMSVQSRKKHSCLHKKHPGCHQAVLTAESGFISSGRGETSQWDVVIFGELTLNQCSSGITCEFRFGLNFLFLYVMAIIQTGMMISGKPSCFSTARISRPALVMMVFMMSKWRLMLLSMGSSLHPCRAILSFMMMTPFGRRLFLQRNRKSIRSLSVKWPGEKNRYN